MEEDRIMVYLPTREAILSEKVPVERERITIDSLPVELIDLIISHIPGDEHPLKRMPGMLVPSETTWTVATSKDTFNSALLALCLTSRRLHEICTPHLYRRFEDKSPESGNLGACSPGQRLLLLLRTVIRNPALGKLVRHVVASTWHSLETDALTEEDMKAVFEQAGMITMNYPLRIASDIDPESVYLGQPRHPHEKHKDVKDFPSIIPGCSVMSNGEPAPIAGFSATEVALFRQHPIHDFAFCSAVAWTNAVRTGEWDAVFTLLLSLLPNMETLAIHNPDAGERCPFAQCVYLTSFMERVAISQQMTEKPREMKRFEARERRSLRGRGSAKDGQEERLGELVRKRGLSDSALLQFPRVKRQKLRIATGMTHPLPGAQRSPAKSAWASTGDSSSSAVATTPELWQPLLPHYRSIHIDCLYRSSDIHIGDIIPFLRPASVTNFFCWYLYGGSEAWPGDTALSLKNITIKHGHVHASALAALIRCCKSLERLVFETAGGHIIPYQSLATPEIMESLEGVKDTLVELDLRRGDMNYFFPGLEVPTLEGYTGYTFASFAEFRRLKKLSLKAESMIRHSEADPEADTGPLWRKLPSSLEQLWLAGNGKWIVNLVPQVKELVVLQREKGILPRLREVVLEVRGVEGQGGNGNVYTEEGVLELGVMRDVSRFTRLDLRRGREEEVKGCLDRLLEEVWEQEVDG